MIIRFDKATYYLGVLLPENMNYWKYSVISFSRFICENEAKHIDAYELSDIPSKYPCNVLHLYSKCTVSDVSVPYLQCENGHIQYWFIREIFVLCH